MSRAAPQRHSILGVQISATNYDEAVAATLEAASERRPFGLSALAVHGVMTGRDDPEHRFRLNSLDMVVPDGQPVRWALNALHGTRLKERVYGPTLMLRVCEEAARQRHPIFLYGSTSDVLEELERNLVAKYPGLEIAGTRPSLFRRVTDEAEAEEIARAILASGSTICFVGLGCPRQEVFVYEFRSRLSLPLLAVGAAFDFHAGRAKQAPALLQRLGLEWLYRLAAEPRRLWRRYILLNPRYVLGVLAQRLGRTVDPGRQPATEIGNA